jgi:hypothetical protein
MLMLMPEFGSHACFPVTAIIVRVTSILSLQLATGATSAAVMQLLTPFMSSRVLLVLLGGFLLLQSPTVVEI